MSIRIGYSDFESDHFICLFYRENEIDETVLPNLTAEGRLRVTAAEGVRAAVLANAGIAIASEWMFSPEKVSARRLSRNCHATVTPDNHSAGELSVLSRTLGSPLQGPGARRGFFFFGTNPRTPKSAASEHYVALAADQQVLRSFHHRALKEA